MSKQLKWFVILIMMLSFLGLACQTLTGGDDEPSESADGAEQAVATSPLADGGQAADGQAESAAGTQAEPFLDLGQVVEIEIAGGTVRLWTTFTGVVVAQ